MTNPANSLNPSLGRLRYALQQKRRPRSVVGWLRLVYRDFITHTLFGPDTERCQDCGRGYPLWHAEDSLYVEVIGGHGGLFCPACFDRRAERAGIIVDFRAVVFRRRAVA